MPHIARLTVLLSLFLLMGGLPAQSASFDCLKASTAREKAICADPALSSLDEKIASAYAAAMPGLSVSAAERLRNGQRSWLRFLDRACPGASGECLTPYLKERVTFLEKASIRKAGRVFATSDKWEFISPETPARDAPDAIYGENAMRYVQSMDFRIDEAESSGEKGFNAAVAEWQEHMWNGFDGQTNMKADIIINAATDRLVSLDIFLWQFPLGAAHGSGAAVHVNYLLDEARPLLPEDIFVKDGWREYLTGKALEELTLLFGEMGLFDGPENTIDGMVSTPERWVITPEGLGINFPVYSVGPYAGGDNTVTATWKELAPWLAKDAPIPTEEAH